MRKEYVALMKKQKRLKEVATNLYCLDIPVKQIAELLEVSDSYVYELIKARKRLLKNYVEENALLK